MSRNSLKRVCTANYIDNQKTSERERERIKWWRNRRKTHKLLFAHDLGRKARNLFLANRNDCKKYRLATATKILFSFHFYFIFVSFFVFCIFFDGEIKVNWTTDGSTTEKKIAKTQRKILFETKRKKKCEKKNERRREK